jgi:hypothetical protein
LLECVVLATVKSEPQRVVDPTSRCEMDPRTSATGRHDQTLLVRLSLARRVGQSQAMAHDSCSLRVGRSLLRQLDKVVAMLIAE